MSLKRCPGWLALLGLLGMTGCCSWCEKHCSTCHPATTAAYPAPTCCVPCAPVQQVAPVANYQAPPPQPGWNRTFNANCTCTQN